MFTDKLLKSKLAEYQEKDDNDELQLSARSIKFLLIDVKIMSESLDKTTDEADEDEQPLIGEPTKSLFKIVT